MRACHKLMQGIVRRVAAGLAVAVSVKLGKEAEELCSSGQCAAAAVALKLAVDLGHLPSRALKAWLMLDVREGVTQDRDGAFELVEEGARLGCHHCQGVMAECYRGFGHGCEVDEARSLELARESSGKGSRYGQYVLGICYRHGEGGVAHDFAQSLALFQLAAAQNLDEAQWTLGCMHSSIWHYEGLGVSKDDAEAFLWYQLAAAQGLLYAMNKVAFCHENGIGVRKNKAEAIRWYRRAQAACYGGALADLQRLRS